MKGLQPVIWMKGTFLSPQHMQTQDRFLENSLHFQTDALTFKPWGFRTLEIDQRQLAGGNFAVSRATGVLPDGLVFDIPESDPPPPVKVIGEFEPDQTQMDLFLAIPTFKEKELNVSVLERRADTRYVSEVKMLRDENSGLTEKPVQVARKNFRLLVEGESQEGYAVLRVARLLKTETDTLQLDPRVIPPLIDFSASEVIVTIARRLVEILAAKSSVLAGTRRHKNLSLADFGSADIASFWLLYTVNTAFPNFRHLFETRRGHPEMLFQAMLTLAGALTTFSKDIHPRDLPVYVHEDLADCFVDLDEKIRTLLETVVPSNFVSLPLKLVQPAIYATALDNDRYLQNTRMYLAISSEMNEGDLLKKVPYLVKVCSANHIQHLVERALPGVALTHTPRPPSQIPVKLKYHYFSLNQSGGAWEAIGRARNLAAFIPAEIPNPSAELVILLPPK